MQNNIDPSVNILLDEIKENADRLEKAANNMNKVLDLEKRYKL